MDVQGADTSARRLELEPIKPVKKKGGSNQDHVAPFNPGASVDPDKRKAHDGDKYQEADQGIFESLGVVTAGEKTDDSDESGSDGHILDVKV